MQGADSCMMAGRDVAAVSSVADLTFLSALRRVFHRNVKSKATLASYGG